jgi:catechol 2,3-dioxygenase-like lactoylglutathione lyase family enzyme
MREIGLTAFLVRDYDEAQTYFTNKLGFHVVADEPLGDGKRWLVVRPEVASGAGLLLAKAANEEQVALIGNQGGGRVFLFLNTSDFARDHALLTARGVEFLETPRQENYGWVAVFKDLYGNKWDLLQLNAA